MLFIQSLEGLVNDVYAAVKGDGQKKEIFSMDGKESRASKRVSGSKGNVIKLREQDKILMLIKWYRGLFFPLFFDRIVYKRLIIYSCFLKT